MKSIPELKDVFFSSLTTMGEKIMGFLPSLVGAIIVIILGWLIARFIAYLVAKILKVAKLDRWNDSLNQSEFVKKSEVRLDPVRLISRFVFWIVMLIVLIISLEIMGWEAVTVEIGKLINYLPKLLIAIAIFIAGMYIANLVKQLLRTTLLSLEIAGAKAISLLAFYIIIILLSITALNQAGINTQILNNNVILIIGSVLLAFAVSFGIGSVDVIKNILAALYGKKNFEIGQVVKAGDVEGEIIAIDNMSVTLKTPKGKILLPAKDFYNAKIEIKA